MNSKTESLILADLGEKQLVKLILTSLTDPKRVVGGRGNDATAIDLGLGSLLAVSVDRCPTPLAYKIDSTNLAVWGELAITCVASDLLAAGAKPSVFVTSILSPRTILVSHLVDLVKAAERQATRLGAEIVAGDTKESVQLNVITFGIGTLASNHIPRTGTKAGDVLIVTGEIGNFTAAQLALANGISLAELEPILANAVLHPKPAFEAAFWLWNQVQPKSGMDLSDGLLSAIFRLCELNNLGFVLNESALPISSCALNLAEHYSINPLKLAFGTGDWQIVYVLDRKEWERLLDTGSDITHVHAIGEFTNKQGVNLSTRQGPLRELVLFEQEHFRQSSADVEFLKCLLEAPLFR